MFTMMEDPCDPISLPTQGQGGEDVEVFVTPLMIASYLGDYTAVDVIIRSSGEKWREAVLIKSLPGRDDSLALAKEALGIARLLYDESKAHHAEAKSQEELDAQEKIVREHATGLEMAEKLVERLTGMKQLALEKKKKDDARYWWEIFVGLILCLVVCVLVYYCLGFIWTFLRFCIKCFDYLGIWTYLRFCIKCFFYLGIFLAFPLWPLNVGGLLLAYYIYTICRDKASQTLYPPKDGINEAPSSKLGQSTYDFCLDGESCAKGVKCTDNILKLNCECGDDLKYICTKHTSADWTSKKSFDPINSESTAAESIAVGVGLALIIGGLLYTLTLRGSHQHGDGKKKRRRRRGGGRKRDEWKS